MKPLQMLCGLLVMISLAAPARADEVSKRAKVHELFDVMHLDRTVQQMTDATMKQVSGLTQQMRMGRQPPPELQAKLDEFQKRVFDLVTAQVSWDKLEPEYTELYMQTYTEQELDDILTFYRSPSGASMIAKTPELLAKSTALSQERMQKIMPQLMQMLQDFVKEVSPPPAANRN